MRPTRQAGRKESSWSLRVFVLAALVLAGCSVASRPAPHPARTLSRSDLLTGLAQRQERMRSVRSLYRVRYRDGKERGGFHGAILVRRPDRLRLETLSLVGALLVLTADGNEVAAYLPRDKVILRGKSTKANLFRFTHIPLELDELTSLLVGLPPVNLEGRWEGSGSSFERHFSWGGGEAVLFDGAEGWPVQWRRMDPDGKVELTADFSDYIETRAGPFPSKITLRHGPSQSYWEIVYREPDVNVETPPSLFVQRRPDSVRELPFESLGG